jgi:SAM-dependent methyltransferase
MLWLFLYIPICLIALYVIFWQASLIFALSWGSPTVYSQDKAVIDAFQLANLKKGELVVDLGCGNARTLIIAAKQFGARGVGVEISPYCYLASKLNVWRAGESKNIKIFLGSFGKVGAYLKQADVVYLYLLDSVLRRIESWFFENISDKARVVSLAFQFVDHKPKDMVETFSLSKIKVRLYQK